MIRRPLILACLWLACAPCGAQPHAINTGWPELLIGPGVPGRPEASCDVAVNRSGDGICCWRTRTSALPVNAYDVWVQPLRRGAQLGSPQLIASYQDQLTGSFELTVVRCAIDERGNWVVVWDGSDPTTGTLQVFARRFHAGTNQLGPELWVSDTSGTAQNDVLPDVAVGPFPQDAEPNFYVVWQEGTSAGLSRIRYRRYRIVDNQGTVTDVPDAPIQANSFPNGPQDGQDRPAIAVDTAGEVTLVWERFQDWGAGNFQWRIMMRRRSGNTWVPVFDPFAPGGFVFAEYAVSPQALRPIASDAQHPPRVAVSNGRIAVSWRTATNAYALRYFSPGPGNAVSVLPSGAFLPTSFSPGHLRHDIALSASGAVAFLYMSQPNPGGTSGRPILARIPFAGFASTEEVLLQPGSGIILTDIAVAAADTGQVFSTWTTGTQFDRQRMKGRRADLNLIDRAPATSTSPPGIHVSVTGQAGMQYQLWPSASPGGYALLPLGDGRAIDVDFFDPLVQAFIAIGGNNPHLPASIGTLDAFGEATAPVILPAGAPPVTISWSLLVSDPSLPFPQSIRLFTHPEPFSF